MLEVSILSVGHLFTWLLLHCHIYIITWMFWEIELLIVFFFWLFPLFVRVCFNAVFRVGLLRILPLRTWKITWVLIWAGQHRSSPLRPCVYRQAFFTIQYWNLLVFGVYILVGNPTQISLTYGHRVPQILAVYWDYICLPRFNICFKYELWCKWLFSHTTMKMLSDAARPISYYFLGSWLELSFFFMLLNLELS